jgi:molybdopterin molybdotransferase
MAAMAEESNTQRITRLTPLATVLALIESRVGPTEPRRLPLAATLERTLAADAVAATLPPQPLALRDGYAVEAAAIADAGPYTPVPFASAPHRIEVGEPLPPGTDAVAPLDTVHIHQDRASATAAVAPGEGVLPIGGNASPRVPLRRAGERVRAIDIAVLATAGIGELTVREPRIRIACGSAHRTPLIDAALAVLARAVTGAGGAVLGEAGALDAPADDHADAVIAIGGTGSGRHDTSVQSLARLGRVEVHGIAVSPGETAALGFVGERPVLLVPGRLDAVLAIWLLIGHPLVARLAGGAVDESAATLPLKRKVTSRIGMTELIPVSCTGGMAEPLGSGYLSLTALARSDGWIVVPADSEGFPANTQVAVKIWP